MIWILRYWKILAVATFVVGVYVMGYVKGADSDRSKRERENTLIREELIIATAKNEQLKAQLEIKYHDEQRQIADTAATLAAGRVRLPKGCVTTPNAASTSTVSVTGTSELPDPHQEALDRFKRGVDEVAHDADEMLAACRVVMDWAKTQNR